MPDADVKVIKIVIGWTAATIGAAILFGWFGVGMVCIILAMSMGG